jgi:Na+-translocating ferredoxin:NAD+ oxidoreductase RnfC subunit
MPDEVRIPLRLHMGLQPSSKVGPGDTVLPAMYRRIPEGSLGARVHASIDGRVTDVSDGCVTIVRR